MIYRTWPIDDDPEGLLVRLTFMENQKLLNLVNTEEIGSLENMHQTKASQCIAEGKGLEEGTVGDEAQFVLTTRNAQRRQCYNKHDDRVTVEIRDEQERECATEVRIHDNEDGSYKISYFPKEQCRYKVTVKVNGGHVLGSPFTVKGQSFQVRPVLSFGSKGSSVGMLNCPWGVAVNARDEIAVTDSLNHRVQIFSSDGNYLRTFGRQGSKNREFINPMGIAFHKNGNIFIVDNGNSRIQIFSWKGKYLRTFALIVTAHPYCARKFTCHVMHRARALSTKMSNDKVDGHSSYPCKIRTAILAGSCRSLGRNPAGIPARFWPPGFFFPAGISPGPRQDSRQEAKFPVAKISPGSFFESHQDSRWEAKIPAAKISPGSCRESRQDSRREAKIPAAKMSAQSCRKAHQDSCREAIIPAAKISPESYRESRQVSRREANSRWQKSRRDLAGNLAKIGEGK